MNRNLTDLEIQEKMAAMSTPELICGMHELITEVDRIIKLLTDELLIRQMNN